jgi:cytochrome c553
MKRLLRWIGRTLVGLSVLGLVVYAVVYVRSEQILRRTYDVPRVTLSIPTDAASIIEGRRLAIVRGCFGGCHGRQAEGRVMIDEPMIARIVAPNLTAATRRYSDPQLAVMIRNGVRPDGRSMVVMPSEAFVGLDDHDLVRIIAFLRTLPAVAGPGASVSLGPLGRVGLAAGQFKLAAQLIADSVQPPAAIGDEAVRGRYLARTVCSGCHGTHLRGDSNPDFTSPNLGVVAAYSPDAFARLLRTGQALGGRNLGTMGPWSRQHLSNLTDAEIAALYRYLHTMGSAAAGVTREP